MFYYYIYSLFPGNFSLFPAIWIFKYQRSAFNSATARHSCVRRSITAPHFRLRIFWRRPRNWPTPEHGEIALLWIEGVGIVAHACRFAGWVFLLPGILSRPSLINFTPYFTHCGYNVSFCNSSRTVCRLNNASNLESSKNALTSSVATKNSE